MIRRLILISLLTYSASVCAAPVVIAIALYAAEVITITQLVLTVGLYIYGTAQQRKSEKKASAAARAQRDTYNAGLQDRTITQIASEAPHIYVYGRARVGSAIVAIFKSGDKDQFKHLVCVHAAHECDAFEDIYIAGKKLATLDENGWVTAAPFSDLETINANENRTGTHFVLKNTPNAGTVTALVYVRKVDPETGKTSVTGTWTKCAVTVTGATVDLTLPAGADPEGVVQVNYQYTIGAARVNVRKHLGTSDDPVDSYLTSVTGGRWPATAVLRGFCYTVVTLDLNESQFQGGIPAIEVVLRGKKIYDPRTDVYAWSQNNALVVRDYLTSEICGVDPADLPIDAYIAAANVCDEEQSFGPRYTFNGAVSSDSDKAAVLGRMAESMAGSIVSTTWDIQAGKYVAPIMEITQDDILGNLAITPGISDADVFNGVKGQYISTENKYVATDFKPYQNLGYVATDGDRELWSNIDFPYTDELQRVHNLCRILTEDQRSAFTVKADFKLKAWRLKVGSRVTLTSPVFGWSSKVFRVTDKSDPPAAPVALTLKEDGPRIWDFADAAIPDETPNTDLPDPFSVPELESLSCRSGTDLLIAKDGTIISRIMVTWPVVQSQSVQGNGLIEIEWQMISTEQWNKVTANGSDTQALIYPVEDGAFYVVRGRTVNSYLNVKSDWTYAPAHQVLGKTQPPADMQQLTIAGTVLSWIPNTELDLGGYRFRFHYGNNLDWNSAAPLHQGLILASPFDMVTRPEGLVTIMGKVVDTSGNESIATANVVSNLGDIPVANVVEAFDLRAMGFPGEISGGVIDSGGDLVADDSDSFYGPDNQSAYGPDTDSAYLETSFTQLIYVTDEIALSQPLSGALMSLLMETQGDGLTIEYRLSGPGSVYGADGDSAYGPDDDPFYESPGAWLPWPGQISATFDAYQFRITLGTSATQAVISELILVVDAPDIVEYIEDIEVLAAGTPVPYTKQFSVIKTVTPTLQANASGAVSIVTDKSINLSPILFAKNTAEINVSGATADVILKGY